MPEESGASVFGVTPSEESDSAVESGQQEVVIAPEEPTGEGVEPGEPIGAEAAPASWEFKFGPKHFKSPEEANQYFSTWNGRITRSDRERNDALSALDEWDKWYQGNREVIDAALKSGQVTRPGQPAPATPAEAEPEFVEGIAWEYVNELLEAGKTTEAQKYIAWKTGELLKNQVSAVRDELRGEFEQGLGPIQEQNAVREMSIQVMLAAQGARNPDHPDVALFPEFQEGTPDYNPDFVSVFGNVWRQLDAQTALRPDLSGVELAYWRTKNMFAQRGEGAGSAAEEAIAAETNKFRQSTANRANAVGGGSSPAKTAPGQKGNPIDRLFKGMESTARDEVFGTRRKK